MKKIIKINLFVFAMGLISISMSAQATVEVDTDDKNTIVFVSMEKAHHDLVIVFKNTESPKFNEPGMPRFLLTDRKGNFGLGIGGVLKGIPSVDFGGISDNDNFYPSLIPSSSTTGDRSQFLMDIANSTVFLKMIGRTKTLGDIIVYVAGNFTGNDCNFRLHNGYVQFLGLLVGYNFTNFMNLYTSAPTITNIGPSGMVNYRVTQISYTYDKLKHWSFTAAAELPTIYETFGLSQNEYVKSAKQKVPDFLATATYRWGEKNQIRAAGVIRNMSYNSKANNVWKSKSVVGWGTQLSTIFNLKPKLSMFGEASYGTGISKYINDTQKLDIDLVPNPNDPNKMQALPVLAWYGGLRYDLSSKVFISSMYSQTRMYSDNNWPAANSDQFKYGQEIIANIFWDPIPYMRTGIEYIRGWRKGFADNGKRHANRLEVLLQYSF